MKKNTNNNLFSERVQSALLILSILLSEKYKTEGLTLSDLSKETGIYTGKLKDLLFTLRSGGFVRHELGVRNGRLFPSEKIDTASLTELVELMDSCVHVGNINLSSYKLTNSVSYRTIHKNDQIIKDKICNFLNLISLKEAITEDFS